MTSEVTNGDADKAQAPPEFLNARKIQADDVARTLRGRPDGVVTFQAYVSEQYTCSTRPTVQLRALYLDDTGWEWVEVPANAIVGQIRPGPNPTDNRSLVFVKREALVTHCRAESAAKVSGDIFGDVDPRGGPNPKRRPPY